MRTMAVLLDFVIVTAPLAAVLTTGDWTLWPTRENWEHAVVPRYSMYLSVERVHSSTG